MSLYDIFDPRAALDPGRFSGEAGAATLLQAAQHFPGGPALLVLLLFFAPIGPGIPAGVLLARHIPLHPAVTFGLYALSDISAAMVCHPLFVVLRRHARRVRPLHALGKRMLALATVGVCLPERSGGGLTPVLSRIATVGFGVDVYTAGFVATGLGVPRLPGWASAIAGDLVWFALLLGTSMAAASVADDDRVIALAMVVAMLVIPRLARRFVPALRPGDDPGRGGPGR
jgi:hypothetical protein